MKTRHFHILVSLLSILSVTFLSGCYTVPHTGRSALHLVSSSKLTALSASQFDQLKSETPISRNPTYNRMVQNVGERIAYIADPDIPNTQWEFVVFDDDNQINAFALPGGQVAVYSGLFKVVQNEDDLAVVIGHEIAHIAAGHGNERMTQQGIAAGGALATQLLVGDLDSTQQQAIMAAYAGISTTLGILPYSRLHEHEADELGLVYAAKAGYDPRAALGFWQRMQSYSQGGPPEFLSTHPSGSSREKRLRNFMPTALRYYQNR